MRWPKVESGRCCKPEKALGTGIDLSRNMYYYHLLGLHGPVGEQLLHNLLVGQGRGVAHIAIIHRNLAQHATHYLAGTCLGQARRILNDVRLGKGSYAFAHHLLQIRNQLLVELLVLVRCDKAVETLALHGMRTGDHGRFGHTRMLRENGFYLGGGHQMAGYVQHVVHAAGDPEIAISIASGTCLN